MSTIFIVAAKEAKKEEEVQKGVTSFGRNQVYKTMVNKLMINKTLIDV